MTAEQAPNPIETQELQFKLLARLRLFKESPQLSLKQSLSLVTSASKFGLIFAGTLTGFDVIQTSRIIEQCVGAKKTSTDVTDFPRRAVQLGVQPTHLDISCDSMYLAVACAGVIRIYDTTSFTSQSERVVQEVRVMSAVQALSWNPGIPNMLAAVMQDGSASVYELKNNTFEINSIPPEAQATCLCWSPKGKQIVIGSRNGSLNQFKPELKIVKAISPPQGDWTLVSVHWLSNFQYAAVYSPQGQQRPSVVIVNTPKNAPISYINYDDITYSNGDNRLNQFYFIHQQAWNVLLVASANSMEVGVLGRAGEGPWQQWQMEDASRAQLPMLRSLQETHPMGMAMDTSPQYNLPWGENQQLPPMPLLLLLSCEGLLMLYWCVNLQPGSVSVCAPPTPLPDTSGLHLFTSGVTAAPAQQETQPSPQKSQPEVAPAAPTFLTSSAPVSFAPPTTAPATAPASQWQQPPAAASSQPAWTIPALSAAQSDSKSTSSWMSSPLLPPAFAASSAPSAFTTPAVSTTQPVFGAQPLSFAPSEGFGKPVGAFVQPSVPIVPKTTPVVISAAPVQAAPVQAPTTLEIPVSSFPVQPPPTVRTPEPEVTEESEQLRKMNEALIEDTFREEIEFCNREMEQLSQRVCNLNVNVLSEAEADKLFAGTELMLSFMKDMKETTDAQVAEVELLRNFILQSFSYVESMKARLRLQNNPDYMSIQSTQGLDPIQARRMADIRSNVQFIENQLDKLNNEVVERYGNFLEANKENREILQIPSMEAVYQAMVVQNNVLSRQKALISQLEAKVRLRERKRVLGLLNVSRTVDNIEAEYKETDVSKITDDFLSLNLKRFMKTNTVEELQQSVADFSLSHSHRRSEEKDSLLKQVFDDCEMKHVNVNLWSSPSSVIHKQSSKPMPTNASLTGITSGTPKALSAVEIVKPSLIKQPVKTVDDFKVKSPFTMTPSSAANASVFGANNVQVSSASFTTAKSPSLFQSTQAVSSSSPGGVSQKSIETPTNRVYSSGKSTEVSSSANVSQTGTSQLVSQPIFTPQTTTTSKAFSFAPVAATQISPPFSTQSPAFGSAPTLTQPSTSSQPFVTFSKTFTFTTTASATSPTMFTSSFTKPESLSSSSLASTPLKSASSESGIGFNVSASPVAAPAYPLASLSSLVSGIEPLKPAKESPVKDMAPEETTKSSISQPFVFKVPSDKTSPAKDIAVNPQITSVFSFSTENKQDSKETVHSSSSGDGKNQFNGAFKKLSFDSGPSKSIFGGNPTAVSDAAKVEQNVKNMFSFSSASSSSSFTTSSPISSQSQKSIFGIPATSVTSSTTFNPPVMQVKPVDTAQTEESEADTNSPVIELCLTPPKSGIDPKTSIEKLESCKGITITKVESHGTKSPPETPPLESNTPGSPMFGFTTPTKPSSNTFGGSPLAKPSVIYEISKPESQLTQDTLEKSGEEKKEPDTTKSQSIFGGTVASTPAPATSFSFSNPAWQSKESGLTFGLKTSGTTSSTSTTTAATFSFAQATTTTTAPAFSFSLSTSSSTTSSGGTFGLGVSTSLPSDDKTKSAFSFGQAQAPATTAATIFGGFGTKAAENTPVFGQTPVVSSAASDQTKSIFGQATPALSETKSTFGASVTSSETKSIFGTPATSSETKSIFGAPTTSSETKSIFGASVTSSETKSIFGTPATSSETKSIFGAPTTSSETKSIFGASVTSSETKSIFGTPATSSETKSIFGAPTTSSETKSIFGASVTSSETKSIFGTPATSSETKSIFGAPTTSSETKSIFGMAATASETKSAFGTPPTTTETKSVFGQPATTENKSVFGQSSSTGAEAKSDFSFSLSSLSVTSTAGQSSFFGTPTTNSTSFFGQQICSPSSAASSPFGQPTTTPSVFGAASSPFGSSSTFGQSGGSPFGGQSSGGFGASGGSMFGSGFGWSQPGNTFGSSQASSGSMFGGGSFSSGGQSVGQTGFGTPAFQNKPAAFGSTSPQSAFGAPPAFGAAPTFGGSPAFGSPPKVFGSPTTPTPGFGSTQQSSTFENLASQNTMTFGNLAQNQAPVFGGSMFGGGQQQAQAPAFAPATTSSSFGGTSFSSWR